MSITHSRFSNLELIDCPDCASLTENGKCMSLRVFRCEGNNCVFFNTKEQQKASMKQVYRWLASLDEATQKKISEKYYNGKRPWMETAIKKSGFAGMEVKEHV